MRILVLGNMYPPHALGGYEMSCRDVMDRLRQRGHEIAVLTTRMRLPDVADPPGEREQGGWRDLEVYWDDHRLLDPPEGRQYAIERHNQRALGRALAQHRPDVVFVWNMGALSLGLVTALARTRLPLVYAVCDDWLDYGPKIDPWTRAWRHRPRLARIAGPVLRVPTLLPTDLGGSGAFCFVSAHVRSWAEEHTPWQFPISTVVYSGIDPTDFPPRPPSAEQWRWRLLYVGRIEARKGVEDAIRALALLPSEATLEVVGRADPDHRAQLDGVVAELDLVQRVRFSVAERGRLAATYAAADAVVFRRSGRSLSDSCPSRRWRATPPWWRPRPEAPRSSSRTARTVSLCPSGLRTPSPQRCARWRTTRHCDSG